MTAGFNYLSKKVPYLSAKSAELHVFHSSPKTTKTKLYLKPATHISTKRRLQNSAKRLEKVLPKIINSDQTGYIRGRFIGENVRLIQHVMFHT